MNRLSILVIEMCKLVDMKVSSIILTNFVKSLILDVFPDIICSYLERALSLLLNGLIVKHCYLLLICLEEIYGHLGQLLPKKSKHWAE